MEQTIFERHEAERNAYYKEHNKTFNQLQADEQMTRKVFGFSDARMPDEWKDKLQRERQAWSEEWGINGWREAEMQSRHEIETKAEDSRVNKERNIFTVPDFMMDEFEKCDLDGKQKLIKLSHDYQDEKATFLQTTFLQKQAFQDAWSKLRNERKTLTADEALKPLQYSYKEKAKEIVQGHDMDSPEISGVATQGEWQKLKDKFFANGNSMQKKAKKGMRY